MDAKITYVCRLRINTDGNGVRTVVFFHDCPLNCVWCCNPETRYGNLFKTLSAGQLYEILDRDYIYHSATGGGITFSGGEPLCHASFIREYLRSHKGGITAAIETSLYASFDTVATLLPYIDQWFVDLKNMDDAKHIRQTGASNRLILSNLSKLCKAVSPQRITISYPFIPTQNDSTDNIDRIIRFMHENNLKKIQIIPHRKTTESKYERIRVKHLSFPAADGRLLREAKDAFRKSGIQVVHPREPAGKEKCGYLKSIRRSYCRDHSIPLEIPVCKFKGTCPGTCPQCERELKFINSQRTRQTADHPQAEEPGAFRNDGGSGQAGNRA